MSKQSLQERTLYMSESIHVPWTCKCLFWSHFSTLWLAWSGDGHLGEDPSPPVAPRTPETCHKFNIVVLKLSHDDVFIPTEKTFGKFYMNRLI